MVHAPCALHGRTSVHCRRTVVRPGQEIARRAIRCHAVYSEATEEQAVHEDREVQDVKPPAIASLKVVELKAELTKLGIAPGKRKKAELIDLLHAAVKESQQSSSTQENDQHVAAVFNAEETDPDKIVESQQETTVAQEPSAGTGRPRRIKFLDISSLDEEQQMRYSVVASCTLPYTRVCTGPSSTIQQHQQIQSSIHTIALWWLGTCAATPTGSVHSASLAMRAANEVWMFDCGDDTQRQLMKVCTGSATTSIKHLKITRLFCTSLAGSRIYGLPGMICTLSQAKGDSRNATTPVHIYGPEGLAAFIAHMLAISDTFVIVPVLVFEFVPGPVDPQDAEPVLLNERAKVYQVRVPADAYNPDGFTEVKMGSRRWMPEKQRGGRGGNARVRGGDTRQSVRTAEVPPPGDPAAPLRPMNELQWTLIGDDEYMVTVLGVDTPEVCLSYVVQEPMRGGNLVVDAAKALGVPPGHAFADLKAGKTVHNEFGAMVHPEQVVTPDTPGRRLLVCGLFVDTDAISQLALRRVDMLLCQLTTGDCAAASDAGMLACKGAAVLARTLDAECVVVWAHCEVRDGRARPTTDGSLETDERRLREEVEADGTALMVPQPLQLSLVARG